jgi:uncharacterized protein (TIGR02246 family)
LACVTGNAAVAGNEADRAAIEAASRAFSAAYVANDGDGIASSYTQDAVLLPPDRIVQGRDAIRRYFAWGPRHVQFAHRMQSESLDVRGDVAIDRGTWHSRYRRGDSAPQEAGGSYLAAWVRGSDGRWRMHSDAWHRSTPQASRDGAATTTFILVRHAEKATDDPRDPALTPAGLHRAERLARLLVDRPLTAVYATDYRRTRQTAQPTAASHGLDVTIYDAGQPSHEFAQVLRRRHPGETVLVVGHSNTIPGIMSQLCECMAHSLEEDEYGDLFEIRSGFPDLRRDKF